MAISKPWKKADAMGGGVTYSRTVILGTSRVQAQTEYTLLNTILNTDGSQKWDVVVITLQFTNSSLRTLQKEIWMMPEEFATIQSNTFNKLCGMHCATASIVAYYQMGFISRTKFKVGHYSNDKDNDYPLYITIYGLRFKGRATDIVGY